MALLAQRVSGHTIAPGRTHHHDAATLFGCARTPECLADERRGDQAFRDAIEDFSIHGGGKQRRRDLHVVRAERVHVESPQRIVSLLQYLLEQSERLLLLGAGGDGLISMPDSSIDT